MDRWISSQLQFCRCRENVFRSIGAGFFFTIQASNHKRSILTTNAQVLEAWGISWHHDPIQLHVTRATGVVQLFLEPIEKAFKRGSPSSLKFWGSIVLATSMFQGVHGFGAMDESTPPFVKQIFQFQGTFCAAEED
ncbi:hypothetical protein OIU79_016877 [Salix purpurea]|uniref:Uncharacterized protein n=1 Tax=Salix purpurea TaxID=77065 RepID=A0A9Q0SRB9_SALPP|nr:hypothetical protein OIU79_016877 [Salix purpurea]